MYLEAVRAVQGTLFFPVPAGTEVIGEWTVLVRRVFSVPIAAASQAPA